MEQIKSTDMAAASVIRGGSISESIGMQGWYDVECYDAAGNLKWKDVAHNTVVQEGKTYLLNVGFKGAGTQGQISSWYLSLVDGTSTPTIAGTETSASHASFTEFPYGSGNNTYNTVSGSTTARPLVTFGTVTGGNSLACTTVAFTINATTTNKVIWGCWLTSASTTAGDAAGKLYSVGPFSGGSKTVSTGDVLNVTYTTSN